MAKQVLISYVRRIPEVSAVEACTKTYLAEFDHSSNRGRCSVISYRAIRTFHRAHVPELPSFSKPACDNAVTLTCDFFQEWPVDDANSSARVANTAEVLQVRCRHRDALSAPAQHRRDEFLGEQEFVATCAIVA
jgi:hypothetical protein